MAVEGEGGRKSAVNGAALSGTVGVSVDPPLKQVYVDTDFTVDVSVAAGDNPTSLADLYLGFDPALLRIDQVTLGTALPVSTTEQVDNTLGTFELSVFSPSETLVTGTFTVCTIGFHALQVTPGTLITAQEDMPPVIIGPEGPYEVVWTGGSVVILSTSPSTPTSTPSPTGTSTPLATPTASATATATRTLAATDVPTTEPTGGPTVTRFPTAPHSVALPLIAKRANIVWPAVVRRFGVSIGVGTLAGYPLNRLPFGWYSDWSYQSAPDAPNGAQYVQCIPVDPERYVPPNDTLRAVVRASHGALWLIGNEPECVYQGNRTPEEYAQIYHDYYVFLKAEDPTCQVAIGAVVQPTPLRLKWLNLLLQDYQVRYGQPMPVDVWNIHNQVLEERREGDQQFGSGIPVGLTETQGVDYPWWENDRSDVFEAQVSDFRRWMADRGQRDKTLIISEYGILYPSTWFDALGSPGGDARVNAYMNTTFDYLLTATDPETGCPTDGNRLVQRWMWLSLNLPTWEQDPLNGFNGNLCDARTHAITVFGQNYERYMQRLFASGR